MVSLITYADQHFSGENHSTIIKVPFVSAKGQFATYALQYRPDSRPQQKAADQQTNR